MPQRRLILTVLAGVAVVVGALTFVTRPREPSWNGIPLSDWIIIHAAHTSPKTDRESAAALRQIGTNALPYLLAWIREKPHPAWEKIVRTAADNLPRQLLSDRLWRASEANYRAQSAPEAFAVLGPAAKSAVPELTSLANDTNDYEAAFVAAMVLGQLGKDGLPPLQDLLTNQDPVLRSAAATHLRYQGTNARPAVPRLVKLLHDPDRDVRQSATSALRKIAPEALTNAPPK